ncbi:glutamyl-tRNA reductase [Penaeicola halotolerans]|uniref:glutamyl-tRNA reductase n=1 Tax=Penaeicola halotolerans TaxID=2793196 RepID=UPI001CF7F5AB|nr:glutamyl-tRNA reductase [Penaeicola halotolerans]
MSNNFKALSLSYKNAPVEIRELLSLDEASMQALLIKLKEFFNVSEAMILSTCNRSEIYYSHNLDLSDELIKLLISEKGITGADQYKAYFEILTKEQEAILHLYRVAMGLEAQVIGDMQISNQVKRAYQMSADLQLAGPFLHRLLHTIFFTNKRVVQETSFRDGAASVSYAAVELIEVLTKEIKNPRVLIIGVGEIGTDVCRNMVNIPQASVKITNRTQATAEALAQECGYEVVPFENILDAIQEADVIVSSIMKNEPFITKEIVANLEILSFKFFIDLSVPRSIETAIEEVPGALLYNVDNIQSKASEALERRIAAIPAVEQIVRESIEEFNDWKKEMMVSPTINKFKNALEQIRQEELARYLKNATDKEAKIIDKVTKSMMQKIIKMPVIQLKAACKRGDAENLIDLLSDLFDLENQKENH